MGDYRVALRARFLADQTIASIAVDRVDWSVLRQGAGFPAIRLQTVSDERPRHMTGVNVYRPVRIQVDCMALTIGAVVQMREAALALLLTSGDFGSVRFGRAQEITIRDLGEQRDEGFVHRDTIDAVLWNDG
jgi:hypothetical protein